MIIVKRAWVEQKEKHSLELTERLAYECETYLKHWAVNPDDVPHISVQTLAQTWARTYNDEGLGSAVYIRKSWDDTSSFKASLVDEIYDWLNDSIWDTEPYYDGSEVQDSEDDIDCTKDESEIILNGDNPDFPVEDDYIETSPEGANDIH